MLKFGVVTKTDPATCRVRVQYKDNEGLESYWLAVIQCKSLEDKDFHLPDVGEHVACLVDEHNEEGVVIGAIYSSADAPPVQSPDKRHTRFKDESEIEYDRKDHALRASLRGGLEVSVLKALQRQRVKDGNVLIKLVGETQLPKELPEIPPAEDWKKLKGKGYLVIDSPHMICLNAPNIMMLTNNTVAGPYVKDLIEDDVYSEESRKE